MNNSYTPVLMIALDAAESSLIEQWTADGTLPHLQRLRERAAYGRLASSADWLAGSPWPTFYTGVSPAKHGLYHFLQWRAGPMRPVRPDPGWLPLRPFWRDLSRANRRVVALDLPMTFAPEPLNGIEISGWASHDRLAPPASYPASTMDWVRRNFGTAPLQEETQGLQRPAALLRLRDELIETTERVAGLAERLMEREVWDLFMVGFGATHRGGHKLWDLSGASGQIEPHEQAALNHALRDVYVACDRAIGRLVERAGEETPILVFSLHGMGPNTSRVELLPAMLDRVLSGHNGAAEPGQETKSGGFLSRLRKMIPLEWRDNVKRRLPVAWQDKLTIFWRTGRVDWMTTRAFSLVADLQGYIRINLKGREAAGIVTRGPEYDQLCAEIAGGLKTFVDADTNTPVVDQVIRTDRHFEPGPCRQDLPDLVVRWACHPAAEQRAIVSPQYGTIAWPMPGHNPDGRSGNHRPEGFLIAAGDLFQPGLEIERGHIVDLAPTIYRLLDLPKPSEMCGRSLFEKPSPPDPPSQIGKGGVRSKAQDESERRLT